MSQFSILSTVYRLLYIIPVSLYYILHIIFAYLYYTVKESLSGGLTELFFNCVFFIDKLFNSCISFINTFKYVRKLR